MNPAESPETDNEQEVSVTIADADAINDADSEVVLKVIDPPDDIAGNDLNFLLKR